MIVIDPEVRIARGALPRRALLSFAREIKSSIALQGEVSILLTGDDHIRQLNRMYRRKDKATDVLSFPAAEPDSDASSYELAGDLAVSLETAGCQADEYGHSLFDEVRILLLHGMLHLKGFNHETDSGQMARKERALRKAYALPLGLIQRAVRTRPASQPPTGGPLRHKNTQKARSTIRRVAGR
jgi:probable rRNA maturation factor